MNEIIDLTPTPEVTPTAIVEYATQQSDQIEIVNNIVIVPIATEESESTSTPELTPTPKPTLRKLTGGCAFLDGNTDNLDFKNMFCFYVRYDGITFIRYHEYWEEQYEVTIDNEKMQYIVDYNGGTELNEFLAIQWELKKDFITGNDGEEEEPEPTPTPNLEAVEMEDLIPEGLYNMDYLKSLRFNEDGTIIEGIIATEWSRTVGAEDTLTLSRFEQLDPNGPWIYVVSVEPVNPVPENIQMLTRYPVINGVVNLSSPEQTLYYQFLYEDLDLDGKLDKAFLGVGEQ